MTRTTEPATARPATADPGRSAPISLVTGANRGIGREVARRLGLVGHTVLLGARAVESAESAARELRAAGLDAHPVHQDAVSYTKKTQPPTK
ncbi:SDR family NAD(P)-dependent oxidoreductase, partial [Embleya sp. NPDC059213]|uniref:SDR family NAD(P)-dependent oxidoreductase n=1 Tax=Embleya sp. NPDC059213 TaxID=3346771 RepID=UPI003682B9D7